MRALLLVDDDPETPDGSARAKVRECPHDRVLLVQSVARRTLALRTPRTEVPLFAPERGKSSGLSARQLRGQLRFARFAPRGRPAV
jgi:hypothetical protein